MKKVALILVCMSVAVVMYGCGGAAAETTEYNRPNTNYNRK